MKELIEKFVKDITDAHVREGDSPMDGDEVQHIAGLVRIELDHNNGNTTDEERQKELAYLSKHGTI